MTYLPVNPCCGHTHTSHCYTTSCETNKSLSSTVVYDGPTLPGSGVEACDTLNTALSKIDAAILELKNQVDINTTSISLITEQIININSQIINIINNCCSDTPTTTTTTTTVAPTTTTTTTL